MSSPLHSRASWGARPRKAVPGAIRSEGVTAHYGGPSPWPSSASRASAAAFRDSTDHARCASILRAWQSYHMDGRGWNDLAYNSAVCPHGHRYEGRGVGVRSGANGTNDGNARSEAVVYIAGGSDPLTVEAKLAFLDEAVRMEAPSLRWDHSDWKPTACAGDPIREWERTGWARPGDVAAPAPPAPPTIPPPVSGGRYIVNVSLPLLRRGSKGQHVGGLQGILVGKSGAKIAVDGDFGPATETAVRNWQRFFGLAVDGIVGPATWKSLLEIP